MKSLKFSLIVSFVFLFFIFLPTAEAKAALEKLGNYPVCEPSSVVRVNCPKSDKDCLLVGDNEIEKSLFLYSIKSGKLNSTKQIPLSLGGIEISDIEALANLGNDQVLIFGSHSRNSQCQPQKERRRFLQAQVLSDRIAPLGEVIQTQEIEFAELFSGVDIENNEMLKAVSDAITAAEQAANRAEELEEKKDREADCQKAKPFNVEGAVAVPGQSSTPNVWLGLRSPLVTFKQRHLAILMHMHSLDEYQFDEVALLDLGGRGIRELTFKGDSIWGIAGGPEDGRNNFVLWKFPLRLLEPSAIIKPEILKPLPPSSEGLAIVNSTAYVTVDGDAGGSGTSCKEPGRFIELAIQ